MKDEYSLVDCSILITRPLHSSEKLAAALIESGASCSICPMLEIEPFELDQAIKNVILNLDQFDTVIVTSQHAAAQLGSWVDQYWPQLPAYQKWFCIGRASAEAIIDAGLAISLPDEDHTSESLIGKLGIAWKDKKILIAKGEGGRDALIDHFTSCEAKVQILDCYRRKTMTYSNIEFMEHIVKSQPTHLLGLSAETVINLGQHIQRCIPELYDLPIIVPSARVAEVASQQGFKLPYVSNGLQASDLIRSLASVS